MKPKAYPVLAQAIEEGVLLGFNRAEERGSVAENSNNSIVREQVKQAIMVCICEYFSFEDED